MPRSSDSNDSDNRRTTSRLLVVVDLDLSESSRDAMLDGLYRASVLANRSREVSLACLYAKDSDRANLEYAPGTGQGAELPIFFLHKDPRQLAPGLMSQACLKAYVFYSWLKPREHDFDLVQAFDKDNPLYFALLARRLGLYFRQIRFAQICVEPLLLCRDLNHQPVDKFTDLVELFMERESLAMADGILSRTEQLLQWLKANGYRIGEQNTLALPPLLPADNTGRENTPVNAGKPGLVYFGRLDSRAELLIYLDAFRRLGRACIERGIAPGDIDITFVSDGKPSRGVVKSLRNTLDRAGLRWSVEQCRVEDYIDRGDARGKLVLMPAHLPGPDLVALRVIRAGLPILGFADSGIDEWLDDDARARLVKTHPQEIAQALLQWLQDPVATGTAIFAPADLPGKLEAWHDSLLGEAGADALLSTPGAPLVSVCVAHYNRPLELEQALTSIARLKYSNFEVIVVDDGSTDAAALRYLDSLQAADFPFDIRVFTQPNLYLGASRNTAARNARGEYLLFMDDDNLAKPNELDLMVAAAEFSQADILTCFADAFISDKEIGSSLVRNRIVFTGADIASGFFRNPYGDSNCLVRKESFDRLGGFSEDFKVGRDDQEFFSRAVLRGYRLMVVPEALYWYKINTTRMRQTQFSQYAGLRRVARPYFSESGLDAAWLDMLRYAQGLSAQKSGITARGVRRLAQNNRLRRIAYAFPTLYKWLRPLIRRL